jgi:hypothetical protein
MHFDMVNIFISLCPFAEVESTLKPLHEASRRKRQAYSFNPPYDWHNPSGENSQVDKDVRSTMQSVQLPFSKGHSAFSIRANTVYILYPSLFQDPNIFGRFAINQNTESPNKEHANDDRLITEPEMQSNPDQPAAFESLQYPQYPQLSYPQYSRQPFSRRRQFKSQLRRSGAKIPLEAQATQALLNDEDGTPQEDPNEKRTIETHLDGTIVVLNQDVNEENTKESY